MAIILMIKWWYSDGWTYILYSYKDQLVRISQNFSLIILLKTLFSPWKQMTSKITLQNIAQAVIDNTISRVVGFVIRIFVLTAALLMLFLISVYFLALFLLWAFVPLAIVTLPFYGISKGLGS